jgi:hypothetical protein
LLRQELWCKKMPPTAQLFSVYKMQHLLPPAGAPPPPAPAASPAAMAALMQTADALGKLLQYRHAGPCHMHAVQGFMNFAWSTRLRCMLLCRHQGFLANARQQRSAGLAAIELAQALQHLVSSAMPRSLHAACFTPYAREVNTCH